MRTFEEIYIENIVQGLTKGTRYRNAAIQYAKEALDTWNDLQLRAIAEFRKQEDYDEFYENFKKSLK